MKSSSIVKLGLILGVTIISMVAANAQCPMCKMAAETNLANGGTEGKGLNQGILYILSLPYLIVGTIGFIWWRNKKRADNSISK